jgi:hypothetical protein
MNGVGQPHLRLVVDNSGRGLDALRYAQSTSGRSCSQNTEPPVSRSKAIASFSEQLRKPYATLRKCPNVVSHFTASDSLSSSESPCQNDLRSMPQYHHTVISKATPFREFTKWCRGTQTGDMKIAELAGTRRQNLARYVDQHLDGNVSELTRIYGRSVHRDVKPSYFNDMLAKRKSFGEKVARQIEKALRLLPGQLDIPDSPLIKMGTKSDVGDEELLMVIASLNPTEKMKVLGYATAVREKRGKYTGTE